MLKRSREQLTQFHPGSGSSGSSQQNKQISGEWRSRQKMFILGESMKREVCQAREKEVGSPGRRFKSQTANLGRVVLLGLKEAVREKGDSEGHSL